MEQINKQKIKRGVSHIFLKLPDEIWSIIIGEVPVVFSLPIKLTCSFFRSIELNEKRNMNKRVYRNKKVTISYAKWAVSVGFSIDVHTTLNAAANGNLEVLKFLHDNECPWDEWTCSEAAVNGHLEVLKYLYKNGCPLEEDICSTAAINGHLEVLIWLHENGCAWDKWSYSYATYNGHLEVLKYLHDNGCPCDKQECIKYAREYNHKECLEYLLQIK